ncbi:uncharacterized protein LOC126108188 [Schistocerca cancellata]|uniref:uncharacterized protein LOC126108188 n=1 Tax=Schistocerca cancellata TaxID=274614 RepID=UPI002118C3E8|nr:uncharacterized protein LOC126108188 [Schistocerca cancellata]
MRHLATKKPDLKAVATEAVTHMSPKCGTLFGMQLLHKPFTLWTEAERRPSLSLFYKSPAAYEVGMKLPSKKIIQKWVSEMDIIAGTETKLFEHLVEKVKTMDDSCQGCVLVFDEMSVRKCLSYYAKYDIIEGYADFGSLRPTIQASEVKAGTSKCFRYIGDFKEDDLAVPGIASKMASVAKKQLKKKARKLSNLQRSAHRMRKKILNLESLIIDLQRNSLISESMGNLLKRLPPGTSELLKHVSRGQTREKYPAALRTFALTLNFYSSKAYSYIRRNFNTSLPHPRTLRRWYSVIDGNPGFSKAVALRIKSQELMNKSKKLLCAMSFDEIALNFVKINLLDM